jgi:hypothetical protein
MAQSSTTISSSKSFNTLNGGSDIRFDYSGGVSTIQSTTTILTGSGQLAVRDLFTISGSNNNNSTFTVKSINSTKSFTVEEIVTNESAGATITSTYAGFVTDKYQGDGYYFTGGWSSYCSLSCVIDIDRYNQNARIVGHNTHRR